MVFDSKVGLPRKCSNPGCIRFGYPIPNKAHVCPNCGGPGVPD